MPSNGVIMGVTGSQDGPSAPSYLASYAVPFRSPLGGPLMGALRLTDRRLRLLGPKFDEGGLDVWLLEVDQLTGMGR